MFIKIIHIKIDLIASSAPAIPATFFTPATVMNVFDVLAEPDINYMKQ